MFVHDVSIRLGSSCAYTLNTQVIPNKRDNKYEAVFYVMYLNLF